MRLFAKQENSSGVAAIGFGLGKKFNLITQQKKFQIAYNIGENEWNDKISTQLMLKDIKPQ